MSKKWIFVTCLVLAFPAFPQFSKYKSKTDYSTDQSQEQKSPSVKNLLDRTKKAAEESEEENDSSAKTKDSFGREVPKMAGNKSPKYVNLNPETAFGPEVVTSFDFPNANIIDLIKHMQQLTGINIIYDRNLKGKSNISISAPTPITVGDAWRAFLTALNMNELSLIKSGAFYRIVQHRDMGQTPTKIYTGQYSPDTDNYVMKIIPLKNINSEEVYRSLRPFISRQGKINQIKQTNTLIIQDIGTNVNRMTQLIKFIDIPGHEETLQIIPVKHSSASELAKLLDKILQEGGSSSAARIRQSIRTDTDKNISIKKITAEPRTNSIIAMANAAGAKKLRELIVKLDVKIVASGAGKIHVHYLNHGDAETLAKTLSTLVSGSAGSSSSKSSSFARRGGEVSSSEIFDDIVKITADKSNNALVVTANPTDYLTIKQVIEKLDVPKDQVYVEGLVMETNVENGENFGISILGAYGKGGAQKAGFTGGSSDLLNLLTNNITNLGGLFIGGAGGSQITQEVNGQSITINSVNALVTAIATNSNSNVLATPQILALDNEEATFEVGEMVPSPQTTNASNGSTTTSIKQQKVAMTLKITPQINKQSRTIKMKIDQKLEDFSNRKLPDGLANEGVATTTRSAVTTVITRDKETVAMGGLMRDKNVTTESKVPFLGDLPLIGWLFRHESEAVSKVNLLLFLTPKILSLNDSSAASTLKDLLNRRGAHLKHTVGEQDPFNSTVKGLYQKAKRQEKRALHENKDAQVDEVDQEILLQEETPAEETPQEEAAPPNELPPIENEQSLNSDVPDYHSIVHHVKTKASGIKK